MSKAKLSTAIEICVKRYVLSIILVPKRKCIHFSDTIDLFDLTFVEFHIV